MEHPVLCAFVVYKFVLNPGEQNPIIEDHVKNSIEYGIRVKFDVIRLIKYTVKKTLFPFK